MRFILIFLCACSAITDTDRFQEDNDPCDLALRVRNFSHPVNQLMEVRLTQDRMRSENAGLAVNEREHELMARAVFDPLTDVNIDLRMPTAVHPLFDLNFERPLIDFYADANTDGMYSGRPSDHVWLLEDACRTGPEEFPHNINFMERPNAVGPGGSVRVNVCGEGLLVGEPALEVRVKGQELPLQGVADQDRPPGLERTAVGFYRLGSTRSLAMLDVRDRVLELEDIVDNGFRYQIEVFVDANRNYTRDETGPGGRNPEDVYRYDYDPESAPTCDAMNIGAICSGMNRPSDPIPPCKAGADIVVNVAAIHLLNKSEPDEDAWVSVPPE